MVTACSRIRLLASFAGLLAACDAGGPSIQTVVYENDGTLCLLQDGEQASLYSLRAACNCSSIRTSVCAAVVEAGRVEVSSRTVIVTDTEAEVCPTGCETRSVRCGDGFPAAGRYEIVQGIEQVSVAFPLSTPVHVLGPQPSADCDDILDIFRSTHDAGR